MTGAMAHTDTIVAIATPAGRGGVGIIRVSGGRVANIAELLGYVPLLRDRQQIVH